MKRHEKPDLSVLYPLPDTIARALFHTGHESGVVNNAVEHFPALLWLSGGGRSAVLRHGARARVALHSGGVLQCVGKRL